MPERDIQSNRFGKLSILGQQILDEIPLNEKRDVDDLRDDLLHTENEFAEVAATLSQFYDVRSETVSTMHSTASDTMPRGDGIPRMANIWLILRAMKQEHLLDFFCASQKTDQSLSLDILTLESIHPPTLMEYASIFAIEQSRVVSQSVRIGAGQGREREYSPPSNEQYSGGNGDESSAGGQTPSKRFLSPAIINLDILTEGKKQPRGSTLSKACGQHSPQITEPAATDSPVFNPANSSAMSPSLPTDSNDESEGHVQDNSGRRRRRRIASKSKNPS